MEFSEEQKLYLQGLAAAQAALRPAAGGALPLGPDAIGYAAQQRTIAAGGKLCAEEERKRRANPLDCWDELVAHARDNRAPRGLDVYAFKFHGLFYVAPAQDSFMCRLRIPNGILTAHQMHAVADLAAGCGGGECHITTRANLQIREIAPARVIDVLTGLQAAGLTARGSGADNIRNITGNPTAGIDAHELYDTRPLGLALHHHILNHRELYGLPRKFNIAFDGGGSVAALEDTNDIGFSAVRVGAGRPVPAGVYFRVAVGGITGHGDFACDLGIVVAPGECVAVAHALVRVFIEHGDRTDRRRARMKYVLDRLGLERTLELAQAYLPAQLTRLPLSDCEPRRPVDRGAHLGVHAQRQPGLRWIGVVVPVGRLDVGQMRGIADIAARHGSGTIRLTVWQNLLISDVPEAAVPEVERALAAIGLAARAGAVRAGLVACTGNSGCRYAASDTKRHALAIAAHLEQRIALDTPLNIHLTGCPHSCAQHYIGDIGLLGARVEVPAAGPGAAHAGTEEVEGYHVYVGGGAGPGATLAREIYRSVPAAELPRLVERMLAGYLAARRDAGETFLEFSRRHTIDELRACFAPADTREAA
jgi:ferredoxin-nitrite reductase